VATIEQIIRQAVNPFDPATFKPGNFWHDQTDPALQVASIHAEVVEAVEAVLDRVGQDHRTRTLLLYGDSGSGKSHLLGRIKRTFNPKAFFVYIDPFPDSDAIWRHILRYTVDSLVQKPEGQAESQLLLWLKSLSVFQQHDPDDWGLSDRQRFIRTLKKSYPSGIYNPNEFFGVLYDLIHPERYFTACEWLRGDDLDEDDLALLKVKQAIESEDAAQKVLANIGKITIETKPIVLCFDQLDNIARSPDGIIDLQALFDVNSSIHNQGLKNFLVIISIITSTWKQNADRIQQADRARIDESISLKPISLDQAEALWASRLIPLHRQVKPQPSSTIYPLERQTLEEKYPGRKTQPRLVLELGRRLIQSYKIGVAADRPEDPIAALKLVWLQEFNQIQERITRIRQLSSPELMQMLREVLSALQVGDVRPKFLPSPTYASHSLSYQPSKRSKYQGRIAIAWNEDPNMLSFYHVMNACRRAIAVELCEQLWLIRAEGIGKPGNKGHEFYNQIFATGDRHQHIQPDLESVHYLATYHSLVNATYAGELVVAGKTPHIDELESLMRESEILQTCRLLKQLGIVSGRRRSRQPQRSEPVTLDAAPMQPIQDFLLDLLKTHRLLGRDVMVQTALGQFTQIRETEIDQLLQDLSQSNQVQILGEPTKPEEQLVCLVAES
jgi:Cdc6-like AAA superfamily ATPase